MSLDTKPDNLGIDFSHRLHQKELAGDEIESLFSSISFMTERAQGILAMMFDTDLVTKSVTCGALDALDCEIKDLRGAIGALRNAINNERSINNGL